MEGSPLDGLARTATPLLAILARFDPEFIQQHGIRLLRAVLTARRRLPSIVQLLGHNHFSCALHLDYDDQSLGNAIRAFAEELSGS